MFQWLLMTLLFIFNFIFFYLKHPLAMGLIMLIQTTLICILSGLITKTFWFSYIMFLVFLGGMLVLFIYVVTLASNEMFTLSMKFLILSIITFIISITFMITMMDKNFLLMYESLETQPSTNLNSYLTENSMITSKLYNYPNNLLTIMLMNYLLITLIAIIKITKLYKGPLRPLFN